MNEERPKQVLISTEVLQEVVNLLAGIPLTYQMSVVRNQLIQKLSMSEPIEIPEKETE